MIRLFVGIALPADLRRRLAALSTGLPGARWISPENMHLTLYFIGPVEEHLADDIDLALSGIGGSAFSYAISGIETFGRGHQVHTLWARVAADAALPALQAKIEQAMIGLGLEPERRKFTPHITLARTRGAQASKVAEWLQGGGGFTAGPVTVESYVLYRSHLGSGGAHYEVLSEYPLAIEAGDGYRPS